MKASVRLLDVPPEESFVSNVERGLAILLCFAAASDAKTLMIDCKSCLITARDSHGSVVSDTWPSPPDCLFEDFSHLACFGCEDIGAVTSIQVPSDSQAAVRNLANETEALMVTNRFHYSLWRLAYGHELLELECIGMYTSRDY
ncbi:hypothetical protein Q31b_50250 [Novipirellula aureliae]|uniref:Uncharacterized protein n=1 Tax=Novipirellula aureliae TaxID=2527966 RepID=A0A5C6DHC5_9BACT|nr:hypothetical protein Q31b_50250 [Novipirellula aureliae]